MIYSPIYGCLQAKTLEKLCKESQFQEKDIMLIAEGKFLSDCQDTTRYSKVYALVKLNEDCSVINIKVKSSKLLSSSRGHAVISVPSNMSVIVSNNSFILR